MLSGKRYLDHAISFVSARCLIEHGLEALGGRKKLHGYDVHSLVKF